MMGRFVLAVIAGVTAGVVSAAGLPFMVDNVFPLIFVDEKTGLKEDAPGWLREFAGMFGSGEVSNQAILVSACMMLPLVFVVRGVMTFINVYFLTDVGMRVVEKLRIRAFERLQFLSLSFHKRHQEGDLLSRVMEDTGMLRKALVNVVADLVIQPATLLGGVGTLFYLSFKNDGAMFMLLALMSVPLCVLPLRAIGSKIIRKSKQTQLESGGLSGLLSENLASQQEIRAYNMQQKVSDEFERRSNRFVRFFMKTVKYNRMMSPMVEMVSAAAVGFAIYMGAQKGLTIQVFIPLVLALYFTYEPIKKLGVVHGRMKQAEASLDRIEEITESVEELLDPVSAVSLGEVKGEVSFEGVDFGYEDELALSGVNVRVGKGETVALVGPSGAGKSTFISLIARFYDVNSGSVQVDGVDVRNVKKHELRGNIALVSQHPLLFRGTIADNIEVGMPGATRGEVEAAAQLAQAHEFITSLPKGYDTEVGERGEGLSGGQRQRVAIARAFLKDAPILILDEATSALDTESEALIQESLRELAKGRTTFMIAHRFSSIRDAGRILVFAKGADGGGIIADGSHAELMEDCSLYRELYERQAG